MSLRVRLVILIVLVVTLVSTALSTLYLDRLINSLSADAYERSVLASQQVNAFIIDRINSEDVALPAAPDSEGPEARWTQIVASDKDIAAMLERTMALSPALVEINVTDAMGTVLTSSNPSRDGMQAAPLEKLATWEALPFYRRLLGLMKRGRDYQVEVPLGIAGQTKPVFLIQVVASSVLLRGAVLPEVQTLAAVSAGALIVSLAITVLVTSRVLRPLRRIERTIDRISQGKFTAPRPAQRKSARARDPGNSRLSKAS